MTEETTRPRVAIVPVETLRDNRLTPHDRAVFVALCAFANRNGMCYPSRERLSEYSGVSRRTISDCIGKLCEFGYLSQELRAGTSPLYIVLGRAAAAIPVTGSATAATPSSGSRNTDEREPLSPVAAPAPEQITDTRDIKKMFEQITGGRGGIGSEYQIQKHLSKGHGREYYALLFETVAETPYLMGDNLNHWAAPLSFILRNDEEILRGKYEPFEKNAARLAAALKK